MLKITKPWYRYAVQIFFFALVALITANKAGVISLPLIGSASLHALCPFGGVVSLYNFATGGTFVQKIHESSFVLMAIGFMLALAFGPVFCGWICPLGTIQEWVGKLGKTLFGKKYNNLLPEKVDKYLRFSRYIVLALVIYATATSAKLVFQSVDPYFALFNFWSSEVALAAIMILGVTLGLSLLVERPWCKYACPYGAVLGLCKLGGIFKVRRAPSSCINCKACDRACPMNISVSEGKTVFNHQCITCLKCTSESSCPIQNTVVFSLKGEIKA